MSFAFCLKLVLNKCPAIYCRVHRVDRHLLNTVNRVRTLPVCSSYSGVSVFTRAAMSTMAEASSQDLVVDHDIQNKTFYIQLAGVAEKAVLNYDVLEADTVDLHHTGVPVSMRGKGIAKILAKAALDHFVAQNTNMKLTCTYLQKYFKENPLPQYKERVVDL
ncbi:protein NATD1-like isoform X1 [Asterias amurensis]|uniref:protein NATD1-like isoform X1 n=2 Tax=Asterias amurensis TaxID=7602 RepID=UPI003AB7BE69